MGAQGRTFRSGLITVVLVLLFIVAAPWAILAGLLHDPAIVLALIVAALFLLAHWRKSHQIRIAGYTSLVLLAWVAVFAPGASLNRPVLHAERFERIHYGLPVDAVERLLGGPPGNYGRYSAHSAVMTLEGFEGPPASEVLLWTDDTQQIEIAVRDDHVVGIHERAGYGRDESFTNRLRRIFEFSRIGPPHKIEPRRGGPSRVRPTPFATAPTSKAIAVPADKPTSVVPLSSCGPTMTIVKHWSDEDRSLARGPGGEVWFVSGGRMGHVTTRGSVWAINTGTHSSPRGIAAGPDGAMWFTDGSRNAIRRVSFDDTLRDFPLPTRSGMPGPEVGAAPSGITAGPDGAMWFVETSADKLGRITVDGRITEFPIPRGDTYHAHPEDIATGPDGALWFTELYKDTIGRFDPKTRRFSEVQVPIDPRTGLGPRSIRSGRDAVWFTQSPNIVGRIAMDRSVRTFELSGNAKVGAIAAGSDGNMWVVDHGTGRVIAMHTSGKIVKTVPLPASDTKGPEYGRQTNTLGRPDSIVTGPDGALWVSLPVTGRLARYGCDANT